MGLHIFLFFRKAKQTGLELLTIANLCATPDSSPVPGELNIMKPRRTAPPGRLPCCFGIAEVPSNCGVY